MPTNWEKCELKESLGKCEPQRRDRKARDHTIIWHIVMYVRTHVYTHAGYMIYTHIIHMYIYYTLYTRNTYTLYMIHIHKYIHACVYIHIYFT